MNWLHISDIHFNYNNYDSNTLRDNFLKLIKDEALNIDFILITGDILFKHNINDRELNTIKSFISTLAKHCNCKKNNIYICPGNHDVDRNNDIRNKKINEILNGQEDFSINYEILCDMGTDKFKRIYKSITNKEYNGYTIYSKDNYNIISLNSCLLSKDDNDLGNLRICNNKLSDLSRNLKNDNKLNILIMHHGLDFLNNEDEKKLEHWIEDNNIDIIFSGHNHKASIEILRDTNRIINQITTGTIMADGYSIPSFHICKYDEKKAEIDIMLYTFSQKNDLWVLDNQLLRKFNNGICKIQLPRLYKNLNIIPKYDTFIEILNQKYFSRYKSSKIILDSNNREEDFNSWKIIDSLINVGISYNKAVFITKTVIEKITDKNFDTKNNILSCYELRNVIYNSILTIKPDINENELEVSKCASKYARKYNTNEEIKVLSNNGSENKINYSYIKNTLIKKIIISITNNTCYYEKISSKELSQMAEYILIFLKNIEILEIDYEFLLLLIRKFMTKKPHPWLLDNNQEEIIKYHEHQAYLHINNLKNSPYIITQIEAAYHLCSAIIAKYDVIIGCDETSPIISLNNALNWINDEEKLLNNRLPILKHKLMQLKKDLCKQEIDFIKFRETVNTIYNNIVINKNITNISTIRYLEELNNYFKLLLQCEELDISSNLTPIQRISNIFSNATGFIVKSPLRDNSNCFWIEPNWEIEERKNNDYGKNILVCLLDEIDNVNQIQDYLNFKEQIDRFTEIVFVKNNYQSFTKNERYRIRNIFKEKHLLCIFIQEDNFNEISKTNDWRNIFYSILKKSKIS